MNWKTMSPITLLIIITVALLGTVGIIYAVSIWQKGYEWEVPDVEPTTKDFTVYNNPERTEVLPTGGTPIDLGQPTIGTIIEKKFYVVNNGDDQITVFASIDITAGATAEWNSESAGLSGNAGWYVFILTLTITGTGSCTVTIS